MRSEVTVLHNQNIQDIAIQETGTFSSVIAICAFNNISLTQDLEVGMVITIPADVVKDADVLRYFKNREVLPATALSQQTQDIINNEIDDCDLCSLFI